MLMLNPMRRQLRYCLSLALIFLCISGAIAQKVVAGKVIDNFNSPVAAATVTVKGQTQSGTQTKNDGTFSITVPSDQAILTISTVGFNPVDVPVAGKSNLGDITLNVVVNALDAVIVTGYSTQKKKDITGAVSVVDVENLKAVPSGTTESLLQGQAAGVTVINSGAPGGNSNVRVRGITSVGNSDPLVIIDGTQGSLHDLNVNDIQSIQVLKDAGAASIYGVRGSNGVIIVTTKKGKRGKPVITYDAYYGTQRPISGNVWNLANPEEAASAIWQTYTNLGLQPSHKQYGNGSTPVIPDYITPTAGKEGDPNTNPATYALYTNQITRANKAGTDWYHEIFRPAHIQSQNISVSGGGEKSTFLFTFGYFDQPGTLMNTYLKRYSIRLNSTFNIGEHIRIGENAFLVYKQNPSYTGLPGVNNANSINAAYRMPSIVPVYDIMGNFAGGGSQSLGNAPNPVAIMARTKDYKGNIWQTNGNVFVEIDPIKHVTLRSSFGGTIENFYRNFFTFTAYENAENSQNPNSYIENYGYTTSYTFTNTIKYNNEFGKHNVNVLLGTEAINNSGKAVGASRGSYFITNLSNLTVDPNLWTLNFGTPGSQTNANIVGLNGIQTPYESAIFSQFGRVDYSYNDKYLFSGTIRRDGASVFDKKNRYGIFPSVTGGWRISEESFMKDVTWVNDLKLRGGWGKLGSISNINPTNAYTLYSQSAVQSYYDINGTSTAPAQGIYNSQFGNPNTTWEEDIITNVGIDATVLNHKLEVSAEWYKKAISGLLFGETLPGTSGAPAAPFINSGNIQNTGIDLALTYHGSISRDFRYDITATFTSYNNKVIALPPGTSYFDYGNSRLEPGHPVGSYFGYKVLGLFQSDAEVAKAPVQNGAKPGRFRYADVNNDGVINASDRTHFGNPNPDFTSGLNIGASYKNFDLFMFLYATVGNDVLNGVRSSTDFPQSFDVAISKDAVYNSWRPDRPNAKVPILERTGNFSNGTGAFNSYIMENGSYLRCKTFSVGYNLPSTILNKVKISKMRVYVQAANLFTLTKYTGPDPELPGTNVNFGVDGGTYPANQKVLTAGVNVSF